MSDETFSFTPGETVKPDPDNPPSEPQANARERQRQPFPYPDSVIPAAPPAELLQGPATLPAGVSFYFPPNWSGLTCHTFLATRFTKAIGRMVFTDGKFVFHFE